MKSKSESFDKHSIPVIGILTIPVSKIRRKHNKNIRSYLANSYVKWIEMSGARVVPIKFNWSVQKINSVLKQVNGVVFPGGDVDRDLKKDFLKYLQALKQIYNYAKTHKNFSIWATCLGFEFLVMIPHHSVDDIYNGYEKKEFIDNVDARHHQVPLILTNKSMFNKMFFNEFSKDDIKYFKNDCIYMNHGYGFLLTNEHIEKYKKNFTILSTNKDKKGKEYISTVQSKDYPIFGTQWHPEKILFESLDKNIQHDEFSQYLSKCVSDMFINNCKKNLNKLKDENLLIYYYSLYSRNEVLDIIDPKHKTSKKYKSLFEECYYFD
jgi:gamma-glutamyl hydrolase